MKAIKVKIYPSEKQATLLEKHFGCTRFIYNLGLELKVKTYNETKKSLSIFEIQKGLSRLKKEKPWLSEVNSQSIQQSLKDLDSAFSHFFRNHNQFPKFKSKHTAQKSFRIPQHFNVLKEKHYLKLPKLGYIRFIDKFNVPESALFRNITISKDGSEYFASICYDEQIEAPEKQLIEPDKTVGIDLGTKVFATLSDGTVIKNHRHLKKYEDKLAEEQRKLSKKTDRTAKSYQKQREKVQKVYKKVRNTRKDWLHKATTALVENQNWTSYCIEDLAVKNLIQINSTPMSKSISDAAWGMWRSMMEYKCQDKGKNLVVIGRFEPSSKLCYCGIKNNELGLEDRIWTCKNCGRVHKRDELAANNIKNFGLVKSLGKDFGNSIS